jgi:DnaJ-class molecular chaperone
MGVEFKDYYRILGVDRKADEKTIKSAYRRLARKLHPDVAKTKDSGERFKELGEAYAVLSDPEKRRRYDTLGPDWQRHAQPGPAETGAPGGFRVEYGGDLGDFSEFFRSVFGDLGGQRPQSGRAGAGEWPGARRRRRGDDVQADVEITLEEAFGGARRAIALDFDEPCPACQGSGNVKGQPCATCHGNGWQRARRQVDVRIPAGVRSGQRVRVPGEGTGAAGERGDLYLEVTVSPHSTFERKGDDVHLTLPITAPEAALGTTLEVPTLRGKVSMKIPPATSSGRTFRLPGYGMPRLRGAGAGDQFVTVKIVLPTELTAAERDLYEKLKALRRDDPRAYQG